MTRANDSVPLLLGHRGARASRHIPENTLESFELCLQHGCDGFEFDVRRSADGRAVICHDSVLGGLEVARTDAEDLRLPLLEQVLLQFSTRAFLDIELKVEGLEKQLVAALRTHPPRRGFVVSSFLGGVLSAVNRLDAGIPLGFLYDQKEQQPPAVALAYSVPHFTLLTGEFVEQFHKAGSKVMTWTVNRAEDMHRLADYGVDAIISDDTELLVQAFR